MTKLRDYFSTRPTVQSQPIPSTHQVQNSAGGYAWAVDDWTRLDRFLILGSEAGTYYIKPRQLTVENAEAVQRCIAADGECNVRFYRSLIPTGVAVTGSSHPKCYGLLTLLVSS